MKYKVYSKGPNGRWRKLRTTFDCPNSLEALKLLERKAMGWAGNWDYYNSIRDYRKGGPFTIEVWSARNVWDNDTNSYITADLTKRKEYKLVFDPQK